MLQKMTLLLKPQRLKFCITFYLQGELFCALWQIFCINKTGVSNTKYCSRLLGKGPSVYGNSTLKCGHYYL